MVIFTIATFGVIVAPNFIVDFKEVRSGVVPSYYFIKARITH